MWGEIYDSFREAVFSMSSHDRTISSFLVNQRDVIFEHLLKLYYYRDTQWRGVWMRSVYSAVHSVPRRKFDNKFSPADFIFQHLWLDVEDVWVEHFMFIVKRSLLHNLDKRFEFLDESVILNNLRPKETHDFVQGYMSWLASKLSLVGGVSPDDVYTEIEGLLGEYPF